MKPALFVAMIVTFLSGTIARAQEQVVHDVWLDVDCATGIGEIDDGLMLIQAFHSPELNIRGVSSVFGNTRQPYAHNLAHNIVSTFGPAGMKVHLGAASGEDFGVENDAVRAMAAALAESPMVIAAVGPVTNVGTLVKLHPELHGRIQSIIVVAGRRPGQRFITTEQSKKTFPRDFNFESDVTAMQAILDTDIPLVLAPWEVSSKVWITREDMASLRSRGETGVFLYATSHHWLARWEELRGISAFNPYDSLALGWLTHPEMMQWTKVDVAIEEGPDERATEAEQAAGATKPYLHVRASDSPRREAVYMHTPDDRFKGVLLERLGGR